MGLDEAEEDEFDCSIRDPHYVEQQLKSSFSDEEVELDDNFMSGREKGRKRKRGSAASGGTAGAGSSLTGAGQAGVGVSGVLAAHPTPGEAVRARDGRGRAGRGGIVS